MAGISGKPQVVGIRLPNELMEIIRRRCSNNRYETVSAYLRDRIIYDITRKHMRYKSPP